MSELTAEECYNNLKDFVCEDTKAFTKQGENGVEVDMESIFDFAEVYYEERTKAKEVATKESNLPIEIVSNCACVNCDTIGKFENVIVCSSCSKEK